MGRLRSGGEICWNRSQIEFHQITVLAQGRGELLPPSDQRGRVSEERQSAGCHKDRHSCSPRRAERTVHSRRCVATFDSTRSGGVCDSATPIRRTFAATGIGMLLYLPLPRMDV
nr:hypothetical protein [Kibdelosporangium sp. MJ126-NF4]CTQ94407.1 hypothetical protein [Kibdelosporangium sp. MJ126-NF4]